MHPIHTLQILFFLMVCLISGTGSLQGKEPEQLELWPGKAPVGDGTTEDAKSSVTIHRPEKGNGTAAIICPGGGYTTKVIGPEGHGIAEWLNEHGIVGVVLDYRLPNGKSYRPLLDAQRAIRLTRFKAEEWGIDASKIGIIGFSAGGHLASTAATHFDDGAVNAEDPVQNESCRPDFAILIYPVITMGKETHGGSKLRLLGKDPSEEMVRLFSNELQVSEKTPPTYLAHALNDKVVVPENSSKFYEALKSNKVPSEYLELPSGGHGLNGYKGPMWDAWQSGSLKWLKDQGLLE